MPPLSLSLRLAPRVSPLSAVPLCLLLEPDERIP